MDAQNPIVSTLAIIYLIIALRPLSATKCLSRNISPAVSAGIAIHSSARGSGLRKIITRILPS